MVDAVGGEAVPEAEPGEEGGEDGADEGAEVFLGGVLVVAPDVAGGGEAVADVHGFGAGDDAVAETTFVGEDDIVLAEVKLFKSEGVEGQVDLLAPVGAGEAVDEAGVNVPLGPMVGHFSLPVEGCVDRGLGVKVDQRFEDVFGTTYLVEPIMYEG